MNASRQPPTDPDDESRGDPPWERQISRPRSRSESTGASVDSKPSTNSADSAAPVNRASSGSMRRQLLGNNPDCAKARTASAPSINEPKPTPREARNRGRGCTRTHACVITPRTPSDPNSSRSGDGPAPLPGNLLDSHRPDGVTART